MQPQSIPWWNQFDFDTALLKSRRVGKPVLLDFHDSTCAGCHRLERTVYSDPAVINAVIEHVVPLRVVTTETDSAAIDIINCYISISTPTVQLISPEGIVCHYWRGTPRLTVLCARQIADAPGRIHTEARGFTSPYFFLAQLLIGRAKAAWHRASFEEATRLLQEVLTEHAADDEASAEARYWASVVHAKTRKRSPVADAAL